VYVNKFRVAGLLSDGLDAAMEQLFEVGVDEMSWDDLSQAKDDWPPVRAAWAYRREAYAALRRVLEEHPCFDAPAAWGNLAWAAHMGFEHERIHLETSSVLIRELPLAFVRKPEFWPDYHPDLVAASSDSSANGSGGDVNGSGSGERRHPSEGADYPSNPLVAVAGARVALGKPRAYPSYGWDNEYGLKSVGVPSFRASAFKVTNGEFHAFVRAGGYSERRWWSADGWGWRAFRNAKWPTFWVPDGPAGLHRYKLRLLFDVVDMHWRLPAVVNYHEASAFLAWRAARDGSPVAYRLVTEAEHMLLRDPRYRADYGRCGCAGGCCGGGCGGCNGAAANGPANGAANGAANGTNGHANGHHAVNGQANGHAENGHHAVNGHAANGHTNGHHAAAASSSSEDGSDDDATATAAVALDASAAAASPDPAMLASGADAASKLGFNFHLAYGSESPVDALAPSPAGFYDTFGSVWEWAEDHFAALPGFEVHPYYDDFSAPCFGGLHHMIVGGSFASTGQLASKFARYQFRPHFFQHAGFRIVVPEVDLSQYDLAGRGGSEAPVAPFFETSCMDAPPPYVGTRPCCCKARRER
jgi:formylglycine-generating enzyme required for sulfatase activity